MDAIVTAVTAIYEFLLSITNFVIELFEDLARVAESLVEVSSQLPAYFSYIFPSEISVLIVSLISFAIIFRLVGRSS